jgi:hypothetical protein
MLPQRLRDPADRRLVLAVVAQEDVEGLVGQGGSPRKSLQFNSRSEDRLESASKVGAASAV